VTSERGQHPSWRFGRRQSRTKSTSGDFAPFG